MEGFTIIGPATPPPLTVGDLLDDRLNRVTDRDIANRILKAKSNANCALAKIDRALSRGGQRPAPVERRGLEYGRHGGGRVLEVR